MRVSRSRSKFLQIVPLNPWRFFRRFATCYNSFKTPRGKAQMASKSYPHTQNPPFLARLPCPQGDFGSLWANPPLFAPSWFVRIRHRLPSLTSRSAGPFLVDRRLSCPRASLTRWQRLDDRDASPPGFHWSREHSQDDRFRNRSCLRLPGGVG